MRRTRDESDRNPWVSENCPGLYMAMGDTAEVVAKRYSISREAQDEFSLSSQQRTAHAQKEGLFDEEIMPMDVTRGIIDKETKKIVDKEQHHISADECNRPTTTLEGLAGLKPYFDPDSGQGSVTAGNSSQLSDGASATLLMSRERADELGVKPLITFRGFAVAGCEPDEMGIGPVFAVPKLLKRHGLEAGDIGQELKAPAAVAEQVDTKTGRQPPRGVHGQRLFRNTARIGVLEERVDAADTGAGLRHVRVRLPRGESGRGDLPGRRQGAGAGEPLR